MSTKTGSTTKAAPTKATQTKGPMSRSAVAAKASRDHLAARRLAEAMLAGMQSVEYGRSRPKNLGLFIDTCIKCGVPRVAELLARGAIQDGMENSEVYLGLAKALRKQKLLQPALQAANQALKLTPNFPEAVAFKAALAKN